MRARYSSGVSGAFLPSPCAGENALEARVGRDDGAAWVGLRVEVVEGVVECAREVRRRRMRDAADAADARR